MVIYSDPELHLARSGDSNTANQQQTCEGQLIHISKFPTPLESTLAKASRTSETATVSNKELNKALSQKYIGRSGKAGAYHDWLRSESSNEPANRLFVFSCLGQGFGREKLWPGGLETLPHEVFDLICRGKVKTLISERPRLSGIYV